jgi:hypothetical protein
MALSGHTELHCTCPLADMPSAGRQIASLGDQADGPSDLRLLDDLDKIVLAHLALKSALLKTRLVRLDSREPHRCAASAALGMDEFIGLESNG